MGKIIDFKQYKNMKDEEKEKFKITSALLDKCTNIDVLLHSLCDSVGVSLVTKHFGERNQIVDKEHFLDEDLCNVIGDALFDYKRALNNEIAKLNESI